MAHSHTVVMAEACIDEFLQDEQTNPTSRMRQRRRHSYHHRRRSIDPVEDDAALLKLDLFLSELARRLDFLESYGTLNLDAGIARAYATLETVRDSCSHVSGELIGAGRRRAKVVVETLESRYHGALATRETLEQKIHAGIHLLEDVLSEIEHGAYAIRDVNLGAVAGGLVDEGRRVVDESIEKAHKVVDEGLEKAKVVVDDGLERARRAKEHLRENIEQAIARAREHGLIRYDDLPHPWRVNPHIVRGYRFTESKLDCLRSVLQFSNESVNIWSHAFGLLIVLGLAFYIYPTSVNFRLSTPTDVLVAALFFIAACKCLVCSTVWHTMNGIAEQTLMERFACVDYTGISFLIAASIMTTQYTAFYCEPVSRTVYLVTTAMLGIAGVIIPWHPTFNRSDMSWARVGFYVALAVSGFIPVLQLNLTRGTEWCYYFYSPVGKSLLVYLLGACVYASKIPERWWPGVFDYVGGSHNLWHLAVLGGIVFHYYAMQSFFAGAFTRAKLQCPMG
ncbi:MAG: hypothetical protein M1823_003560 [Watsoniomyces obsoletus]|nr:MAG: hypothetical protein M1823_003560 [Watsoniomyces obsoletus]